MEITRTYICSREKFLELKGKQKEIVYNRKNASKNYRDYINARNLFYTSKGMTIPDIIVYDARTQRLVKSDELHGFTYQRIITPDDKETRYFNVIYALVKGRTYQQIEQKVHEGNGLQQFYIKSYCDKYGVDYNTIKGLIWQTS
jgi:hypothetical protein